MLLLNAFSLFFLIRSHVASIWDKGQLVLGRHFNTQLCNFILPCSGFFCDIKEKVLVCMCLQVVVTV